jgi:hypothetical protein
VNDLVAISALSASGNVFSCTLTTWVSSMQLQCRMATDVPLGAELQFQVNVRGSWGRLSSVVFRTVPPPVITTVSPSMSAGLPSLFHLFGSFNSELQEDVIAVKYGPTGVEYSCSAVAPLVMSRSWISCKGTVVPPLDTPMFFQLQMGAMLYSPISTDSFVLTNNVMSISSVCPMVIPSVYPTAVTLFGAFQSSSLASSDITIPLGLVVSFRTTNQLWIRNSNMVSLQADGSIVAATPLELQAGSALDVRISIGTAVGPWKIAAFNVTAAMSYVTAVIPRIVAPRTTVVLTLNYSTLFLCSNYPASPLITNVWWGGQGLERTVSSFSLLSNNRLQVTIPGTSLTSFGELHGLTLEVQGVRTPPSLRKYMQTAPMPNDRYNYSLGSFYVQSQLNLVVPSKLTGAVAIQIGPAAAPMFGPLSVQVLVYVMPALPSGSPEVLQNSFTFTWTSLDWAADSVPTTLLSVASTFRVVATLDSTSASPSSPYFVAPPSSISVPGIAATIPQTVFGPGAACSATGNDSTLTLDYTARLSNPADVLFDASTSSYLILDQVSATDAVVCWNGCCLNVLCTYELR